MQKRWFLIIAVAVAVCAAPAAAADMFSVLRVIDGDTLTVWDGEEEIRVRLIGIDTPESRSNAKAAKDAERWGVPVDEVTAAGKQAAEHTRSVCPPGIEVELRRDRHVYDAYGRVLAYVIMPDGRCLNEALVAGGYALVYRREVFRDREKYIAIEAAARHTENGFWSTIWRNIR